MIKLSFFILLLALSAHSTFADDGEMKAEIQEVLNQRHPMDTDAWWKALGPEAPGVIIGMYRESSNMLHKLHLLQGLSVFREDADAVAFLKAETKSQTSVVRGTALGALGASQGEKALDTLAEGLKHEDPQTRFAAAKAIHRLGSGPPKQLLDAYFKTEKTEWIARQVQADEKPQGLQPVGQPPGDPTPEDFVGTWKGFLISPTDTPKTELRSVSASASFRILKDKIEGDLTFSGKRYTLRAAKPVGGRWQGTVQQTLPRALPPTYPSEMQLTAYKKGWTLVFRIPTLGETAVLLKK